MRSDVQKLKKTPIAQIGDRWDWEYVTDASNPEIFNKDSFVISDEFYNRLGYSENSGKFNRKRHSDIYSYLNTSNPKNVQMFAGFIGELLMSTKTYDVKCVMVEFKTVSGDIDGVLKGIVFGYVDEMLNDPLIPRHLQGMFLPLNNLEEK
ncbi:hypothetical protein [Methanorbis furvi]